jgi:hypothetical protein
VTSRAGAGVAAAAAGDAASSSSPRSSTITAMATAIPSSAHVAATPTTRASVMPRWMDGRSASFGTAPELSHTRQTRQHAVLR